MGTRAYAGRILFVIDIFEEAIRALLGLLVSEVFGRLLPISHKKKGLEDP